MRRVYFVFISLIICSTIHGDEMFDDISDPLDFSLIGVPISEIAKGVITIPKTTTTKKPNVISCGPTQICAKRINCINGRVPHNSSYAPCKAPRVCCDMSLEDVKPPAIYDMAPCGFGAIGNRTNTEAVFGEFPWMVAVLERERNPVDILTRYIGGGSLLAPTVVLTSMRVVEKTTIANLWVRAGEYDPTQRLPVHPIQERNVNRIISHEYYDPSSLVNGSALLIIETPFSGGAHIRPICLPIPEQSIELNKSRCIVTGWGSLNFQQFDYQTKLKKREMSVLLQSECNNKFQKTRLGPGYELNKGLICAGGEENVDACQGDGGSPLICPLATRDRYIQVGIVAWGIGCGNADVPGAYVNVVGLLPWLKEKLDELNINKTYYMPE